MNGAGEESNTRVNGELMKFITCKDLLTISRPVLVLLFFRE